MMRNYLVDNDPKKPLIMGNKYTYHDDDGSNNDYWFMGYSQITLEDKYYQWASFICAVTCDNYRDAMGRHQEYGEDLGIPLNTDTCHKFSSKG